MPDFTKHDVAVSKLTAAQDVEKDNRERAREAHMFVDKKNGQWEDDVWDKKEGSPRYQFDQTGPIIKQITGKMKLADFSIKIRPAGGGASKEDAKIRAGMIRNIENLSKANKVYSSAGTGMVTSGIDGWRVVQKFANGDSFDQDLMVERIYNFIDRVWFDPGAEEQDKSDAGYCYVLQSMTKDDYEEEFPEGSGQSLGEDRQTNHYFHKAESVVVGQIYYKRFVDRTLNLMTDDSVLEENDDFERIRDELAVDGITVDRTRKDKKAIIVSRIFDAGGWLTDKQDTVFDTIPVVPTYGNYKIVENKSTYYGAVEKLMDPQRVYNYSKSREIAEGALAPRAKWWMTLLQQEGHGDTLSTLNTNNNPVQTFNADPANPGIPQQNGGAIINAGLVTLSESMRNIMSSVAGLFAASMGDNPGLQSGVAIDSLQNKGDVGTVNYFDSQEVAICRTASIIDRALPKVYDTKGRQVEILNDDGTFESVTLNEFVRDEETRSLVMKNDLSKGTYSVACSAGATFQSKQQETVAGILEIAAVSPRIMDVATDILVANMDAPGMDQVAERLRVQSFNAGIIPESQMTDEEKAKIEQLQQQPQQPDAMILLAQAEQTKADAAMGKVQIAGQKVQIDAEKNQISIAKERAKLGLDQQAQDLDVFKAQSSVASDREKTFLTAQQNRVNTIIAMGKLELEQATTQAQVININADTMKKIREAAGIDVFTGPGIADNFITQSNIVTEAQGEIN